MLSIPSIDHLSFEVRHKMIRSTSQEAWLQYLSNHHGMHVPICPATRHRPVAETLDHEAQSSATLPSENPSLYASRPVIYRKRPKRSRPLNCLQGCYQRTDRGSNARIPPLVSCILRSVPINRMHVHSPPHPTKNDATAASGRGGDLLRCAHQPLRRSSLKRVRLHQRSRGGRPSER